RGEGRGGNGRPMPPAGHAKRNRKPLKAPRKRNCPSPPPLLTCGKSDIQEVPTGSMDTEPPTLRANEPAPQQGAPLLEVRGVTLQYKTPQALVTAVYRVDFDVARSDRYVVLGPSGCGKSSLLKAVGGYIKPVEGRIALSGRDITRPGPDRVMVFQEFDQLLPWK